MIESLRAANPGVSTRFFLLHDGSVTTRLRGQLRAFATRHGLSMEFIRPEGQYLERIPPSRDYSPLIWYRVWLPELLGGLDRVLYLDADTLVLQDLRPLWHMELGDHLVAAVAQPGQMYGARRLTLLGTELPDPYFNSGVLVMNLAQMRAEDTPASVVKCGCELAAADAGPGWVRAQLPYPDQDAYNLVCKDRWLGLHPKWNCFASLLLSGSLDDYLDDGIEFAEAIASPAILHFEGTIFSRPWNYRCVHPYKQLYRRYRSRTPWPLGSLDGAGPKGRLLSVLPIPAQLALGRVKLRITERDD